MRIIFTLFTLSLLSSGTGGYCMGPDFKIETQADMYVRRMYSKTPVDQKAIQHSLKHLDDGKQQPVEQKEFDSLVKNNQQKINDDQFDEFTQICQKTFLEIDPQKQSIIYNLYSRVANNYSQLMSDPRYNKSVKVRSKIKRSREDFSFDNFYKKFARVDIDK